MPNCNETRSLATRMRCSYGFYLPVQSAISWEKLKVAVNTNGSLCEEEAGFGVVICDENGASFSAITGSSVPSSVMLHELQETEVGLKLAHQNGLSKIFLDLTQKLLTKNKMAVNHLGLAIMFGSQSKG